MSRFWSRLTHDLDPYVPGEQPRMAGLIKLNTNESPHGPSPRVLGAIRAEATDGLRLYPDPQSGALRVALAAYHGVAPGQVFVGNGSEEVLAHAFAALLKQDGPLLFPDITYSFYPAYCRLFGIVHVTVPLDDGLRVRVDDYRRPAGAVILPNPNAPTGIALTRDEIVTLLEMHPHAPVVIDEAYVDFGAETSHPAGRPVSEPAGGADDVQIPGAGGPEGRLCHRRRSPDRGTEPGEGQFQLLPVGLSRPGRRHRLDGG